MRNKRAKPGENTVKIKRVYISGYMLDDGTEFDNQLCAIGGFNQEVEDYQGDCIFYWFDSVKHMKSMSTDDPDFLNRDDTEFVITEYSEIDNPDWVC